MVFLPDFSAGASGVIWAASRDGAVQKGAGRAEAMDREDGEASAGLLRAHRGYRGAQLRGEGHGQKESGRYVPLRSQPHPTAACRSARAPWKTENRPEICICTSLRPPEPGMLHELARSPLLTRSFMALQKSP